MLTGFTIGTILLYDLENEKILKKFNLIENKQFMVPVRNINVFQNSEKLLISFENASFLEFDINADYNEDMQFY